MRPMLRLLWTAAIPVGLLAGAVLPARAEPLPLPTVDYSAKATMFSGMSMLSRHSKGKMRIEMSGPGLPQAMTAYIDLKARKIISVMSAPGMPAMAVEANLGDENNPAVPIGEGNRVGTANVAGETCDLWQIDAASKIDKDMNAVACVSRDSIPLRVEATIDGKRQVIFEVSELTRAAQDAKLFVPPTDVKIMQIPKGLVPVRK